jgi:hypothetical protein
MGERCEFSGQMQLTALEGRLQAGDELATKHAPKYGDGNEEAWVGSNPAGVITGESAGGNDTVDMRMKLEFLVPGMQHAEEADLGAEMGRVTRHCDRFYFLLNPFPDGSPFDRRRMYEMAFPVRPIPALQ